MTYAQIRDGLMMCNMTNITLPDVGTNLDIGAVELLLSSVNFYGEIEEGLWDAMMVMIEDTRGYSLWFNRLWLGGLQELCLCSQPNL